MQKKIDSRITAAAAPEQTFPLWAYGSEKHPNLYSSFHAGALPKAQSKWHG